MPCGPICSGTEVTASVNRPGLPVNLEHPCRCVKPSHPPSSPLRGNQHFETFSTPYSILFPSPPICFRVYLLQGALKCQSRDRMPVTGGSPACVSLSSRQAAGQRGRAEKSSSKCGAQGPGRAGGSRAARIMAGFPATRSEGLSGKV